MSYFIIGGTNVAVGQKSGGRNVGGRNVCGTFVCRTKVAPPWLKTNVFNILIGWDVHLRTLNK